MTDELGRGVIAGSRTQCTKPLGHTKVPSESWLSPVVPLVARWQV